MPTRSLVGETNQNVPKVLPEELLEASQDLSVYRDAGAVEMWLGVFRENWANYSGYDPIARCQVDLQARILQARLQEVGDQAVNKEAEVVAEVVEVTESG
jgi:hypothetical protein